MVIFYNIFHCLLRNYIKYVSDGGLQDINDVFSESSTYQPSVPSADEEIVVSI